MSIKAVLFDLDGTLLPMDMDVFINSYFGLLARKLAEILEIDEQKVNDEMAKTNYQFAVLARRVEKEVSDQIRAFITDKTFTGSAIQGVHLQNDSKRYYPYSSLASHVIGFLDGDNKGAYGLEAIYEEELQGTKGVEVTAQDANGYQIMFQY